MLKLLVWLVLFIVCWPAKADGYERDPEVTVTT